MSDEKKISLEDSFVNLEEIIKQMESPDVTLNQSFDLYKKGLDEIKNANSMLDKIEKEMLVINAEGELEEF
ncbi:MAG: exodeoxyribonuclease VII small subunit [Agathobacter sp.]|nr:exodeoxyribonuclease VII small subunit [Agathobacter sp.]